MPKARATACGGEGQRACCPTEVPFLAPLCQQGLVVRNDDLAADLFVPVSGDATCAGEPIAGSTTRRSTATCVSPSPSPIAEPVSGWTATPEPRGIMRGYLDMHLHLLGEMAHGGKNLVGQPAPTDAAGNLVVDAAHGVNEALSPATDLAVHKNPYHGITNDTSGDGTGDGSRTEFGAPYFSGWPKWTSTTHQQSYYVWLERAWRGGLRTTTLFASHVESLCKTSLKATRETSWPLCEDSMLHVVRQLQAAYDFQNFIDGLNGGTGRGWFRIVKTPAEARAAVRAGKLAVVLGIEVDNLFNCKEAGCPADFGLPRARIAQFTTRPAPSTVEEAVDIIYDMGVRQVFPIHNFDNAFGGSATWMDPIGVGQAIAEQRWWVTRDCGAGHGDYGFWLDNAVQSIMLLFGFGVFEVPPIPVYTNGNLSPDYASCNEYGLTSRGTALLRALMNKGILIDIDHMGANSLDETIAVTSAGLDGNGVPYPLLASHVQPFDLHQREFEGNKGRHERMRTRAQLAAIRSSGGMVAAMLKDDVQDTDLKGHKFTVPYTPVVGPAIADDCRHSSKSWAQAFQYAVDAMGGPVAMGSDFNGAAGHLGPRFGSDACGGWGAPNGLERPRQELGSSRITYPFRLPGFGTFDNQVTGFKQFDYNVDGLAHIGLLPDLVADLQEIGLNQYYVDALFCSAEAYIRVWERADALAARLPAPDPNRPWLCDVTDSTPPVSTAAVTPDAAPSGWHRTDVVATITAIDADSGVAGIEYSVTNGAQVSLGSSATDVATVTLTGEGERTLTYFAADNAGNVESATALTIRIDRTAPTITASRSPASNSAGWNAGTVTMAFSCSDALSGIETCPAPRLLADEGAQQSASGDAIDKAGNSATAAMTGVNIDRTAPAVSVTGVTDGAVYDLGAVPAAGCSTSDALSGVATPAGVAVAGGTSHGVGIFTVTCAGASDVAGNTGSATASYAVHYVFTGFMSPVNNPPTVNVVRAGQTVPVKFALGGAMGLDVLVGGSAVTVATSCGAGTAVDLTELPVTSPGGSVLTFDAVTGLYQFNWQTDRAWSGSCRRLIVRLDDGTLHTAEFRLR
jgi:microsomal dipeptidase-like Zn-dependent dipeptidase